MKTLHALILTIVFLLPILHTNPSSATDYIIATPPPAQLSNDHRQIVFQTIGQVIISAQPDDTVTIYDALTQTRLGRCTVPEGPQRVRLRLLSGAIQSIKRPFTAPEADDPSTTFDLPRFAREVIRPAGRGDAKVRVVVLGNLFDACAGDVSGQFAPGEYPSDGFITDPRNRTTWGTTGREDDLEGATIHWCYLGESGSNPQRDAAIAFYTKWFSSMGATLVEVASSGNSSTLIESAIEGNTDPMVDAALDLTDRRIVIRRVGQIQREENDAEQALNEARTRVDQEARDVIQWLELRELIAYGQPIDLYFYVDTSMSWDPMRADVLASIEAAARVLPDYSPRVRVSVIPFREEALDRFDLARIMPTRSDGGESHATLGTFLEAIEAESSRVDIASIMMSGLVELERSPAPGRTVLCLITDTDPLEWDAQGTRAGRRIAQAVQTWAQGQDGHRMLTIYVGQEPESAPAVFMQSLSTAAGDKGSYTHDLNAIIREVLIASLHQ